MRLENLSDGENDGFVLFYLKDKKLHSVLLNEEQASMLDISLNMAFSNSAARVVKVDEEVMKDLIK